jgi:acyl phosphate:glycerol-3-phosphate acyltransferase
MSYVLSAVVGYLLGSIPTGYILLKKTKGIDITQTGSGNVGAYNSYEISNSKFTGLLVMIIDALKGLLSVYIPLLLFPLDFIFPAVALFFAVFSHCFNPWIKLRGGRGLATGAGGSLLLFPFAFVIWVVLWVIIYLTKRDILFANIWATAATLIIILLDIKVAFKYAFPSPDSMSTLALFAIGLLTLIFIKHIDPLRELIQSKKLLKRKGE